MPNQPNFYHFTSSFWHIQPSTAQSEDFWMVSSWVHRILMSKAPKWSKFPSHGMAEKSLNKPGIKKAAMLATSREIPIVYIYIVSDSHSTTYHQLPMGNPIDVLLFFLHKSVIFWSKATIQNDPQDGNIHPYHPYENILSLLLLESHYYHLYLGLYKMRT